MIIHAVLSPATAHAVQGLDELHTLAQVTTRDRTGEALLAELTALGQLAPDVLLIAVDAGPPEAMVAGLRQYRAVQPHVRIILLAPGRQPGDPLISTLVGLGVYDILSDTDLAPALRTALASPPATYAQAVRWHHPTLQEPPAAPKGQPAQQEREILRVMASRDRPLVIAVTGVTPASGSTTLAWTLATALARRGLSVTLLLDAQPHEVEALASSQETGLSLALHPSPRSSRPPSDRLATALERAQGAAVAIVDAGALRNAAETDPHLLTLADQLLVCWPQSLPRLSRVTPSLRSVTADPSTESNRIIRHALEHGIHVAYLCPPGQIEEAVQLVQGLLAHLLQTPSPAPIIPVPLRQTGLDLEPLLSRLAPAQQPRTRRGPAPLTQRLLPYLVAATLLWLGLGAAHLAHLPLPHWLRADLPAAFLQTLFHRLL